MEPRGEIETIQLKGQQIADESLDSTRRMLMLVEESEDVGVKTMVMLGEQGEQLNRVEDDLDKINKDMAEAEKNLTSLEKCCGICNCNCFSRKDEYKDNGKIWQTLGDDHVVQHQPSTQKYLKNKEEMFNETQTAGAREGGGFITRVTNDAREEEMEENMIQVSNIIGNLRNMAIDMGDELEQQNDQIDRLNIKAESNEGRIKAASERTVKLLKS